MKKILALFVGLSLIACTAIKDGLTNNKVNLYDDLVGLIVQESFEQEEKKCLNDKSVSFEFKFPESFNGGITKLSIEERDKIEREFRSPSINWNDTLKSEYKSKESSNCLHISKPVFFRNNQLAFIYTAQLGAEFYEIYEKANSGWKFKENISTILN